MISLSRTLQLLPRRSVKYETLTQNIMKTSDMSIMHTTDVQHLLRLVFRKSVLAVNPPDLVQREILVLDNKLHIREKCYNLKENCYLVGFGKCVVGMASKVEAILGKHLQKGIISVPHDFMASNRLDDNKLIENSRILVFEGAKDNLPDENAELAAKEIKGLVGSLGFSDILLVLISGGGSALLPLAKPPVTLQEKLEVVKKLGGVGADIVEMNTVRKKLSLVKGGGLASLAYPTKVISLILSDIIGDPLDMIASGPTVINTDSEDAALNIIQKYGLEKEVAPSVMAALKEKSVPLTHSSHLQNLLIGNNLIALEAAARECKTFGFNPIVVSDSISGFVSEVADLYTSLVILFCKLLQEKISKSDFFNCINPVLEKLNAQKHIKENIHSHVMSNENDTDKFCLIFGGEPTVKVVGDGLGGRNQELALRFAMNLHELETNGNDLENCDVIFLSGGTDGVDGPTNAAGAIAYSGQIKHAIEDGLDPASFLSRSDSYNFFLNLHKGKDHIVIGHTGVNVMDIHILVVQKKLS
ncbi:glycerate kinase [Homalodisca vitripennis]|uniref:Glycerate kinase n=1 Tax=Homalodisca liturata TaxID=320908 RepID=A0A1B6JLL0_9HEMI|nr:glycerate kinase [Homalodisca vitripennis]